MEFKKYKYKIATFYHKDDLNDFVIHYENKVFNSGACETFAKYAIEQTTGLNFIKDENKLIERKLLERENGIKKIEKYLLQCF